MTTQTKGTPERLGGKPRTNPDDAFATFMDMSESEWQGYRSQGGIPYGLESAEGQGYAMACVERHCSIVPEKPRIVTERESWLEGRRKYLGGTDMSAILNLNPYRSALQVFLEKKGLAEQEDPTPQMRRGTRAEPYLAETYTELTGRQIVKSPTYRHPSKSHCAVNPDYETVERDLLTELKSHSFFVAQDYGAEGTDEVPQHEVIQTTWEMHLSGIHECDLFVAFGWDDLRIYRIRYDAELGGALEEQADRFWFDYILSDCPPPISGAGPDTEWLKKRFPADTGGIVTATPEIDAVCLELADARRNFDLAKTEKERCENILKQFMGSASILNWSGLKPFTWKKDKDSEKETCDLEMLMKGHPLVYNELKSAGVIAKRVTRVGARKFLTPFKSGE